MSRRRLAGVLCALAASVAAHATHFSWTDYQGQFPGEFDLAPIDGYGHYQSYNETGAAKQFQVDFAPWSLHSWLYVDQGGDWPPANIEYSKGNASALMPDPWASSAEDGYAQWLKCYVWCERPVFRTTPSGDSSTALLMGLGGLAMAVVRRMV